VKKMSKYKQRATLIIDAIQFTGNNIKEIENLTEERSLLVDHDLEGRSLLTICDKNGLKRARDTDWVLKFKDGRLDICPALLFEQIYEEV